MIIQLKNVRLSFSHHFVASAFKAGDEPKFKSIFLLNKRDPQIAIIEQAIKSVAVEAWKDKAEAILRSIRGNANKFCFQDGDTKTYDGYQNVMALSASSKRKPLVLDRDKSPLTEKDGRPYNGCYVNCSVDIFKYDNSGNGISADLRGIQFYKDGDAFSGAAPLDENEFESISDFGSENAPGAPELL